MDENKSNCPSFLNRVGLLENRQTKKLGVGNAQLADHRLINENIYRADVDRPNSSLPVRRAKTRDRDRVRVTMIIHPPTTQRPAPRLAAV